MLCFPFIYVTIIAKLSRFEVDKVKILRIIFCVLSCLCVAAVVPIAIFFEWWCCVPLAGGFLFGGAMFFMIKLATPKVTPTDYMNTDEENEKILREREQNKKE